MNNEQMTNEQMTDEQLQLSDVLDECLTLLRGGATIEECLARYPRHANDLRPLLEVALRINRLPQPSSSPTAFAAGKRRMLEALKLKGRQSEKHSVQIAEPALAAYGGWCGIHRLITH